MEMTLRLPSSYVDIERDEMEYVEGGIGYSYSQIRYVVKGFSGANTASQGALAKSLVPLIPVMFIWLNAIPAVGQALFGVVCLFAWTSAVMVATAYFMHKGINIGLNGITLTN
jgi:hypothetical protein